MGLSARGTMPSGINSPNQLLEAHKELLRQEGLDAEQIRTTSFNPDAAAATAVADPGTITATGKDSERKPPQRTGRWTLDEKLLFLYCLQKFGKGRWKKMKVYLPNRSLVQIKSHAQKVLKRIEAGENLFRRLDENSERLEILLAEIHEKAVLPSQRSVPTNGAPAKRKRRETTKTIEKKEDGTEHIIAASALCQLGAPTNASTWENEEPSSSSLNDKSDKCRKMVLGYVISP